MRKCRWHYGLVLIITALLLFGSGKMFLLLVLALELVLPFILWVLLRLDVRGIALDMELRPTGMVGKETELVIGIRRGPVLLAAGQLHITVEYSNQLLDLRRTEQYALPLRKQEERCNACFTPALCGEERVLFREAVCMDLFGLCRAEVTFPGERRRTIYPMKPPLQLITGAMLPSNREGEQYNQSKRGMDASEIFDLREYHPGDDVRSIHWKLSCKMDTMILRESSDTSHYNTVLLFDAGLGDGEKEWDKEALSAAVSLGITLSEKLLELGLPHNVELPVNGKLTDFQVGSMTEHRRLEDTWMGMRLPEKDGTGLPVFLTDHLQDHFTKIIYVTAGKFPEKMYSFSGENTLTAICVLEAGESVHAASRGNGQLLEIPYRMLMEQKNRFFV